MFLTDNVSLTFRNQIHRDSSSNGSGDPYIPLSFADLLRVALAKMIGCGWLHPSLGGIEFWNKWPVKYQTVRSYERQKVHFLKFVSFLSRFFNLYRLTIHTLFHFTFQKKGTPKAPIAKRTTKKRTEEKEQDAAPAKKKAKKARSPVEVEIEEEEADDTFDRDVQDEIEEEVLPATQLPSSFAKRRETRSSKNVSTPTLPAGGATITRSVPGRSSAVGNTSGSSGPPTRRIQASSKPPQATVNMTQKRKENISSSFLASLRNKGISEELKKTKRYNIYLCLNISIYAINVNYNS